MESYGIENFNTPFQLEMYLARQDRAHGLPAADLNGLSDPYVTAQINDIDAFLGTFQRGIFFSSPNKYCFKMDKDQLVNLSNIFYKMSFLDSTWLEKDTKLLLNVEDCRRRSCYGLQWVSTNPISKHENWTSWCKYYWKWRPLGNACQVIYCIMNCGELALRRWILVNWPDWRGKNRTPLACGSQGPKNILRKKTAEIFWKNSI